MESWACKELSGPVWSSAGGRFPAPGVYEMDCDCVARLSRDLLDGNRLFADRFVSHRQPLLPLKGGLWLLVGVEQKLTTDRAYRRGHDLSLGSAQFGAAVDAWHAQSASARRNGALLELGKNCEAVAP